MFKVKGFVSFIGREETFGTLDQHTKKMIVLSLTDEHRVKEVPFWFYGDDITHISGLKKDDVVTITFKLSGYNYINKTTQGRAFQSELIGTHILWHK